MRLVEKDIEFAGQLEHLGEGYVRAMLADGGFPRNQRVAVEAWLNEKEAARADFRDKQIMLSIEAAQRAAIASEGSAKAAEQVAEAAGRAAEGSRRAGETISSAVAAAERSSRWAMWAAIIAMLTIFVPLLKDQIPVLMPILEDRLR